MNIQTVVDIVLYGYTLCINCNVAELFPVEIETILELSGLSESED